jgi:hypothetical protein
MLTFFFFFLSDEWGVKGFEGKKMMMMVVRRGMGPIVS